MDNNNHRRPLGDCPGLDGGPKTKEHEGRFLKQSSTVSQIIENGAASMINGDSAQNAAK